MALSKLAPEDQKNILGLHRRLRLLARARSCADVSRKHFSSRLENKTAQPRCTDDVGAAQQRALTLHEAFELVQGAVGRSKVRSGHGAQLQRDIDDLTAWAKAARGCELTEVGLDEAPSGLVGALAVHFIDACEGAAGDADADLVALDQEITAATAHVNPDGALAANLARWARVPGDTTSLCLSGQTLSRATRQGLLDVLSAQNALRVVHLSDCSLRDADFALMLPVLGGMQHLRVLSLPGNLLSTASLAAIEEALLQPYVFPTLQLLDVSANELPERCANALQKRIAERFVEGNKTLKADAWLLREGRTGGDTSKDTYALSLDGGLSRTLTMVDVLVEIELKLGRRLDDVFSIVSGSGFGGIVAAAVRLAKPLADVKRLLSTISSDVFSTQDYSVPWALEAGYRRLRTAAYGDWFSPALLQTHLEEFFGAATTLGCARKPLQIVATEAREGGGEFVFRNYDSLVGMPHGANLSASPVALLCRAACATPTLFAPVDVPGVGAVVDGGVLNSNPSLLLFSEIVQQIPVQSIVLVSLGCGKADDTPYSSLADLLARHGVEDPVALLASAQRPHECLRSLANFTKRLRYHRLDPVPCRPLLFDYTSVLPYDCHAEVLEASCKATQDWLAADFMQEQIKLLITNLTQ